MSRFTQLIALLVAAITVSSVSYADCPAVPKLSQPLNVLIVTGGHPFEATEFVHFFDSIKEIKLSHLILDRMPSPTGPVGDVKTVAYPVDGLRDSYDVVIFYDFQYDFKGSSIPDVWMKAFQSGKGAVFLHHAGTSYSKLDTHTNIVGGTAVHPGGAHEGEALSTYHANELQTYTVVDHNHPITCSLSDFKLSEEAYDQMRILPGSHILLKSDFPKVTPAVAWVSPYPNKRVVYIQPGHGSLWAPAGHPPTAFQSDAYRQLVTRAILWSAGKL